jgi:hypothetical protein
MGFNTKLYEDELEKKKYGWSAAYGCKGLRGCTTLDAFEAMISLNKRTKRESDTPTPESEYSLSPPTRRRRFMSND